MDVTYDIPKFMKRYLKELWRVRNDVQGCPRGYTVLIVPGGKFNLYENLSPRQFIKQVLNERQGITVIDDDFIECAVVIEKPEVSIVLGDNRIAALQGKHEDQMNPF